MLDDITPSIRPLKEVRVISCADSQRFKELPVESKLSFLPFVKHLKEKAASSSDIRAGFYNYLVQKFESEPALLKPVEDVSVLNDNQDLIELLTTSLFPLISDQEHIFTLAVPYQFSIFSFSPTFGELFTDDKQEKFLLTESEPEETLHKLQSALIYEHVLEKFYNIKLNENTQLVMPVTDPKTGMKRYYKLRYDHRFIEIKQNNDLPDIHDCAVCLNSFRIMDFEKQMDKMPISNFSMEGFGIWIAEDVTTQESIDSIKKILLRHERCDAGVVQEVKKHVHALIGMSGVTIGLTPFMKLNNRFVLDETCTSHSIMGRSWKRDDEKSMQAYNMCVEIVKQHPEPTAFTILDENVTSQIPIFKPVWEEGVRSYIVYPIQDDEGLLGLLELTSPTPNQLDLEVLKRVEPVVPLISLALLKTRNTFNDRIESIIKENFTALQPSVEWKFAEAAWNNMDGASRNSDRLLITENVVFNQVYPLYGAIDIRNSSAERSLAIQKDLREHLDLIDRTLDALLTLVKLPLLEGIRFKVQNFRLSLDNGLAAEDEIRFNEFFKNELTSIFTHLQNSNPKLRDVIQHYFENVEQEESLLYRYRNEYEESMTMINNAVMEKILEEEDIIQQSYPHYFEKYKTDGVEYTIYIGQSICPDHPFDLMYLRNLRLWQIQCMAEVARLTLTLTSSLKIPLQTTQLILVHGQPISIGFRKDERRFDVEGAYNIRYEMMKKRLDKVHILGTKERLTQPGKIAVVYSNPKEAQEYHEYISYLQSKNLLMPGMENLELEELQGVRGLKALRVDVNYGE